MDKIQINKSTKTDTTQTEKKEEHLRGSATN